MISEALITEARARITWGEYAASVREYLVGKGVPPDEAAALVRALLAERNSELRKRGIVNVCLGALLVLGSFGGIWAMFAPGQSGALIFASGRAAGVLFMVGVFGIWMFCKGIFQAAQARSLMTSR